MELMEKRKSRKGFTLPEVLVVVAIVATALAVAVPAAIGSVRHMQLRELDDTARSIFLAAQNRMTAMVGNGTFEEFAKDDAGAEVCGKLSDTPSDFPKKADGTTIDTSHGDPANLRYLDSDVNTHEDALAELLPAGSIELDLTDHHYVVEYNCVTGAVYAVWYSDKTFTYDSAVLPRDYDDRLKKSPLVGYYGGSGVEYALVGQMPVPEVTLTNAEELRLHIEMPMPSAGSDSFGTGEIGLEIKLTGKTSGVTKTIVKRSLTNPILLCEGKKADLMLDTLNTYPNDTPPTDNENSWTAGQHFYKWADVDFPEVGAGQLIPGEDISVTVTTYFVDKDSTGKLYLPKSVTVSGNSLFARVEEKADPDPGIAETVSTAMIACGRHLQNLDILMATGKITGGHIGTDGNTLAPKGKEITAAEQIEEIDFQAVNGTHDDDNDIYYWANTYGTVNDDGTIADDSLKSFLSINNEALQSYNGYSLPIRNISITEDSAQAAGLLAGIKGTTDADGAVTPAELNNVVLINPAATGTSNVGALAGVAGNVKIENCQVYLEADDYNPDTAPKIAAKAAATTANVGGLVGAVQNTVDITDSFASAVGEGRGGGTGGLVGAVDASGMLTITKSYAAGYLTGGKQVGGLVGNVADGTTVTVENSYAAGIIEKTDDTGVAAGLVASGNPTIKNSYAAVQYGSSIAATTGTTAPKVYGAAQSVSATGSASKNVYYVLQTDVTYEDDSGTALISGQLSGMDNTNLGVSGSGDGCWYQFPAEKAGTGGAAGKSNPTYSVFPYKQTTETNELSTPYPYPMLLADGVAIDATGNNRRPMLHYGDWLETEMAVEAVFYWELEDGKYHFYTVGTFDGEHFVELQDDLCTDHHDLNKDSKITDWGYGVFSQYGILKLDDAVTTDNTEVKNGWIEAVKAGINKTIESDPETYEKYVGFDPTKLNPDASKITLYKYAEADPSTNEGGDQLISFQSKVWNKATGPTWYWGVNLGFGAAIDVNPEVDDTHMGKPLESGTEPGIGKDRPYQIRTVQQLDNIPDGNSAHYEQTHDLYGADYGVEGITSGDKTFEGYVTGIGNRYRGADKFTGTYDGGHYRILELSIRAQGGLFRELHSGATLQNIILYSPSGDATITDAGDDSSHSIGGLALSADNGIVNIENCVVSGYTLTTGTASVGGLVGVVNFGAELYISNCAAVNTLSAERISEGAGGLVGDVHKGTLSIVNSYAGGKIIGASESGVGVGGTVGKCAAGNKVTYTNVYSYVDLTDENLKGTIYAIGPTGSGGEGKNCYYLKGYLPAEFSVDTEDAAKATSNSACDYDELTKCMNNGTSGYIDGFSAVDEEHSYHPDKRYYGDGSLADQYPFPAVVKGWDESVTEVEDGEVEAKLVFVHYGDWPTEEEYGKLSEEKVLALLAECTCTTHCESTDGAAEADCPVCTEDSTLCQGCTCDTHCEVGEGNPDCPRCAEDLALCQGCTCDTACTAETLDSTCPKCKDAGADLADVCKGGSSEDPESEPDDEVLSDDVSSSEAPDGDMLTDGDKISKDAAGGDVSDEDAVGGDTADEDTADENADDTEAAGDDASGEDITAGEKPSGGEEPGDAVPDESDPTAGDSERMDPPDALLPDDVFKEADEPETSDPEPDSDTPQEGGDA